MERKTRNFKLILAYDGTDFAGWQGLSGKGRTVQETLERALEKELGQKIEVVGSGRTDAGVHAEHQVANFRAITAYDSAAVMKNLNGILPGDLACVGCEEVDEKFHARFNAVSKTYRYRIHAGAAPDPFARRFSLHTGDALDFRAMEAAGGAFVGKHNFQSFTNLKEKKKSFEREVFAVRIEGNGPFVDILMTANGFLYNQARIMAQAIIDSGLGKLPPERIRDIIRKKDRKAAPGAAGAFGLCLVNVTYREHELQF
jgi:tRNA pseudouridine38-40 synthase